MSIVNQTTIPDEIIVCDDCSTDGTVDIINEFRYEYNNIHWNIVINDTNVGFANNFFNALYLVQGDYIFLSDQDDIWNRKKIEKMFNIMKKNNKIDILFSSYQCIDNDDNVLKFKYLVNNSIFFLFFSHVKKVIRYSYNSFVKSMNIAGMSMCIRKKFVDDFFKLKLDNLKYHDLFLALYASIKNSLYFYNDNLVQYRLHNNNTIGLKISSKDKENRVIWLRNNTCNQKLIRNFIIYNKFDNKYIFKLEKIIRFNENRVNNLCSRSFLYIAMSIFKIKLYPSILSYISDIKYILFDYKK